MKEQTFFVYIQNYQTKEFVQDKRGIVFKTEIRARKYARGQSRKGIVTAVVCEEGKIIQQFYKGKIKKWQKKDSARLA